MSLSLGELLKQIFDQGKEQRIPVAGSFELLSRCNLKCKMCYVCQPSNHKEAMDRELSTEQWLNIAEQARNLGALFITLTGGEIFLRKDIKEIYEKMSLMGFRIVLYTNGTLITPKIAKWLSERPPAVVCITVYGGSKETYERICGDGTGFEKVLRGIDSLLAEGIEVDLRATIVRGNLHDYEKIERIAEARNIKLEIIDYITPRREEQFSDPINERLSPTELLKFRKHVEQYKLKKNILNKEKTNDFDSLKELEQKVDFLNSSDAFRCVAGKCGFWVSWDGKLMPCGILDVPQTRPLEVGFSKAWEELKKELKTIPSCLTCKNCRNLNDCSVCPAKLKLETGFLDQPAPYLCELTKQATCK